LSKPEDLSDAHSAQLSRDIAKKIETEMSYPGQIKVTVVRESRLCGVCEVKTVGQSRTSQKQSIVKCS